jgi:hypothetical protein
LHSLTSLSIEALQAKIFRRNSNEKVCKVNLAHAVHIVKEYISTNKDIIPTRRQQVAAHGNRNRCYTSEPREAYRMDWGLTDVLNNVDASFVWKLCVLAAIAVICYTAGAVYFTKKDLPL